jgi:DNA-binding transcriptional LysR family regulator
VSTPLRILAGIFVILHGLVHPLLAVIPPPKEEHTDEHPATMGSFWTKSWLFGEGPKAKIVLYALSALAALALLVAGITFIALASWAKAAWLGGAGLSLLVLLVYWKKDFVYGIGIDGLMIAAAFLTSWLGG